MTILFIEREYCPSYCCSGRSRESGCRTDKLWCQRQCPVSGWSEPQDMNQQTQKHVDKKLNSFVLCCYFVFCRKVSVPCTWQHRRTTWKWWNIYLNMEPIRAFQQRWVTLWNQTQQKSKPKWIYNSPFHPPGWLYSFGSSSSAGSRERGGPPDKLWHQRQSASSGPAHRGAQWRHAHCCRTAAERPKPRRPQQSMCVCTHLKGFISPHIMTH